MTQNSFAEDWDVYPLSELVDPKRGVSYGVVQPGQHDPDGVPIIRVNNLHGGRIETNDIRKVKPEIAAHYQRTQLRGSEVLLSVVGTVGETVVVSDKLKGWNVARAIAVLPVREEVGPEWVNICLKSAQLQTLIRDWCNTTVQATLNLGDVNRLPIPVPPPHVRHAITEILGRLDDKIEVNRRINRTLEAMAQALYQHWFVDFGPFQDGDFVESTLGPIPAGWAVKPLSSQIELLSGGTPKTSVDEYWDGDIDWVAASDVAAGRPFIMSTGRTVTRLGVENSSTKILPAFTTVITARGTVGECAMMPWEMAINQTNYGIRGTGSLGDFTTYLLITNAVENLRKHAYGTVFDTITRKTFDALSIPVPPAVPYANFEHQVATWFTVMLINQKQNAKLAAIRDYLLPKLLSGEVPASAAAEMVAGVDAQHHE